MTLFLIFQGIDQKLAAGVMLAVKIIDALDDVIFGYFIDRLHLEKLTVFRKITGEGKYLPWFWLTFALFPLFTILRRARLETGTGKRRIYSGKYALSHLVYCAHCGDIYRRTQWWIRGEKIPVWRCISRIEKRKANVDCPSRTIYEKDMHAAVITAFEFKSGLETEVQM